MTSTRTLAAVALTTMIGLAPLAACGDDDGTSAARSTTSTSTTVAERTVPDALATQLQSIADAAVAKPENAIPGTIVQVRLPGHRTWSGAAGDGDIAPPTPMASTDAFRAGSNIKPFIATVTLQLVEEARLSLDDTLPAVLPSDVVGRFAEADRITVRMLLNHTSGIAEYTGPEFDGMVLANPNRVWTVGELLARAAAMPRTGAPGEHFAYSNTDYNLLGLVIEHVTGEPWRTAVRSRVIDRLSLRHTSLPEPGTTVDHDGLAHGYQPIDGALRDFSDVDSSMADAGGGHALLTTAQDLTTFLDSLLRGALFDRPDTLRQMLTFVDAVDEHGKTGYGLGLERYTMPGGVEVVGHLGGTAGYLSFVGHVMAKDVTLAVVVNNATDPSPVLLPALDAIAGPTS